MALINVKNDVVKSKLLVDRFIVPPFSVLDTKQGYWRDRVNLWKSIGIKSEMGRKDSLTFNLWLTEYNSGKSSDQKSSIFDPVLCELCYKWFSRNGDRVIDPFAGGSVRGIVSSVCGRYYTGIDLSSIQINFNIDQFEKIKKTYSHKFLPINWVNSDSLKWTKENLENKYDFMLTCPPYFNLEVYSDLPEDLSNIGDYEDFLRSYSSILTNCVEMLENNSFAVIVVGNVRDNKTGEYFDLVGDTCRIMMNAGMKYYNEMILVNAAGTLPIRAPLQFNSSRKIGKQHQNVLVFYKGDTKIIKDKFGEFE